MRCAGPRCAPSDLAPAPGMMFGARQPSSGTGEPASACLRMAIIWLSVKRDVFMQNFQNLSLENSTNKHTHLVRGLPDDPEYQIEDAKWKERK
jgi:hypothetical protein